MGEGEVYIILVNYNNHDDTLQCLDSISDAGYGDNVVVIDNNSIIPDINEIRKRFPRAVLIKNKENLGFGKANNIGIEWVFENKSDCEYIFILNNDTTIDDQTIPILIDALKQDEKVGMATPRIVIANSPDRLWYGGGEMDWRKGVPRTPGFLGPANTALALKKRYVTFASGCAMFFRSPVLKELKGFDPRFFMYCEDMELCLRVIRSNWKIIYEPNAIVKHRVQGSQRKSGEKLFPMLHPLNPKIDFYFYHMTKNRLLNMKIHADGPQKLRFYSFFSLYMAWKVLQIFYYRKVHIYKAITLSLKDYFKETL